MRAMILAAAALLAATPALAQEAASEPDTELPDPADRSDSLTIGVGAGYAPDYEGSNNYKIIPAAAIRGRFKGIDFQTRGTYLALDVIPRGKGKVSLDLGPIAGVRLNRKGHTDDPVVALLPRRKAAFEVGGFAGVTYHGLTNPYDNLSARLDVVTDVSGVHKSTVFSPTVAFGTPLSRKTYASLSLSGDFVGDGYADTYFSITPADALASGLSTYDADGGFKGWKLGLLANQSLTGDLLHGLSIFAMGNVGRLSRDFAASPIVADRGSRTQYLGAIGLAYSF